MEVMNTLSKLAAAAAIAVALLVAACDRGSTGPAHKAGDAAPLDDNAPALSLTASSTFVPKGGAVTLRWRAVDAKQCKAAGAWSGAKASIGSETLSAIGTAGDYILICTGAGGEIRRTVRIDVLTADTAIRGRVDSSFIQRAKGNHLYVFAGHVRPDDYDGDGGDPRLSVPVTQAANSCLWSYHIAALPAGDYTLAFTNDAAMDTPGVDDALRFRKVATISKGNTALVHDLAANKTLKVGPGRQYQAPSDVAGVLKDGDVVEIDAGTYVDDIAVWRAHGITLRGVGGGRAHMKATKRIPFTSGNDQANGKGIWVTNGNDIRVENIEFSGARVPDANGAGIRAGGTDLTVCNAYFHDNENGILGGAGHVLIEYSEFNHNGLGEHGRTHNMYILAEQLTLQYSYSHHTHIGHHVKTRAKINYILYNRIMDEATGKASYAVDVPNGGLTFLIGNNLQQGKATDEATLIRYGAEGLSAGRVHRLYVVNNTLVNHLGRGTFIAIAKGTEQALVMNNLFTGGGRPVRGTARMLNNLVTDAPGFQNAAAYDYQITADSPARGAAATPGTADGFDLTPQYEYQHPLSRREREQDADLDIGAYEY